MDWLCGNRAAAILLPLKRVNRPLHFAPSVRNLYLNISHFPNYLGSKPLSPVLLPNIFLAKYDIGPKMGSKQGDTVGRLESIEKRRLLLSSSGCENKDIIA